MPHKYGYDRTDEIFPLKGERLLDEGEEIPEVHREYIAGHGWLRLRQFVHKHPGANRVARVFGNYVAYACPIDGYVAPSVPTPVEKAPVAVPDVPAAPAKEKKTRTKRKSVARTNNELVFDE